jgi:hypothetical protein
MTVKPRGFRGRGRNKGRNILGRGRNKRQTRIARINTNRKWQKDKNGKKIIIGTVKVFGEQRGFAEISELATGDL